MTEVADHDLRDRVGKLLDRLEAGEAMTVTRDGTPIAELRPLPRRRYPGEILLERWRDLLAVDPARLRADNDEVLDQSL